MKWRDFWLVEMGWIVATLNCGSWDRGRLMNLIATVAIVGVVFRAFKYLDERIAG